MQIQLDTHNTTSTALAVQFAEYDLDLTNDDDAIFAAYLLASLRFPALRDRVQERANEHAARCEA